MIPSSLVSAETENISICGIVVLVNCSHVPHPPFLWRGQSS